MYAHVDDFDQHRAAREWLDERLNGSLRVGLPWASLVSFLRSSATPACSLRPEPVASAWRQVEAWLDCEPVWIPEPGPGHREILARLLPRASAGGNLRTATSRASRT